MAAINLQGSVLLIGPFPPPLGGQSILVKNILESRLADRFDLIPFNIAHSNPGPAIRTLLTLRFLVRFLVTLIKEPRIRVLHIHTSAGIALLEKGLYIAIGKLAGKRIVLHLHGGRLVPSWINAGPGKKRLIKGLMNSCDLMVVLSRSGASFVVDEIAPETKVVLLPNAVESVPPCHRPASTKVTFLYVGHLKPEKGMLELLEAFRLCLPHCEASLRIMGCGDTEANERLVRAAYADAALPGVTFLGVLSGGEKWREFKGADVFVLPSHSEDMPITILEAMACALPVLSTPVGAIPEMIEQGVNGYLVPPRDPHALADAMRLLAENPRLREALGSANRAKVQREYCLENYLQQVEGIYLNLLEGDVGDQACRNVNTERVRHCE